MSRDRNKKKFGVWEFRFDAATVEQEIYVTTSGALQLSTTLSDGSVLTGTDVTQFRMDIHKCLQALHELVWSKKIVVAVKGTVPDPFGRDSRIHASLDLVWGIRYVAKGPKIDLWREHEDDKQSAPYHHIGAGGMGDDCVRVLPWSQHTEDFLTATTAAMKAMGERVEAFFSAADLENRIAAAPVTLLLEPAKPDPALS